MDSQSISHIGQKRNRPLLTFGLDLFFWTYSLTILKNILWDQWIQNLRYPVFSWQDELFLLVVGFLISLSLFFLPDFSLGKYLLGEGPAAFQEKPFWKRPAILFGLFHLLLTLIAGASLTKISFAEFFSPDGLAGAKRIFVALFSPEWKILDTTLMAAVETIYMALMATLFAIPIAFLMSFFAARNLMEESGLLLSIYYANRFVLNLIRAIEPLVWAIIFSVWVGIGPFAGMLALCLHSVASLAKLYSEQIENISEGPVEAMMATGAHPIQVIWFAVVPQIILPFLAFTIYRWDINVRMATVIGLVGGGGIGTLLMQYQGLARWNEVGLLILVIAIIVGIMDFLSSKIRAKIK